VVSVGIACYVVYIRKAVQAPPQETGRLGAVRLPLQPLSLAEEEVASLKIPQNPITASPPGVLAGKIALDTLGQNPQGFSQDQKKLQKRARKKAISKPLAARLAAVAKSKQMLRGYNRTLHRCGETISQGGDGKVITYYCKARHCVLCGSIRTAIAIHSYGDEIRSWDKKFFVTLTIPNVSAARLRSAIKGMLYDFRVVTQYLKRKYPEVKIMRSLEVSYSGVRNDFHPHFHCIVSGKDVAKGLLTRWLHQVLGTSSLGQDLRQADNNSVMEVFKYAAKLSQEVKGEDGKRVLAPAWALDEIFSALKGVRCLGAVGFRAKKKDTTDDEDFEVIGMTKVIKRVGESVDWDWVQGVRDWADLRTGEVLTEYEPSRRMDEFIHKLEEG
jgi:hypothetical protein